MTSYSEATAEAGIDRQEARAPLLIHDVLNRLALDLGGMVVTGNEVLARLVRALRNPGQDPDASSPDFIMPGFNYRMTEFRAALGLSQMSKLDHLIADRLRPATYYRDLLDGTPV